MQNHSMALIQHAEEPDLSEKVWFMKVSFH